MPDFGFREELMKDQKDLDVLYRYTKAEVGGQGRNSAKAFMEAATNRADAHKRSLPELLTGYKGAHAGMDYYPEITHTRAQSPLSQTERDYYDSIAKEVREGSNIANFATGNASGGVGFAGGPMTATHGRQGLMEKFGIEGWTSDWAKSKGYTGALPTQTSVTAKGDEPQGDPNEAVYGKRTRITVDKPQRSLASKEPDYIQPYQSPFTASDIAAMPVPTAPEINLGRMKVPDYG